MYEEKSIINGKLFFNYWDILKFSSSVNESKFIKKQLSSKHNPFFFITELTINLNDFNPDPYMEWIKSKIDAINYYVNNNKLPTKEDPFVDIKKCFFCPYTNCCELK